MTSTLYFYKLPINLLNKNFVLESLETYLGTLTPVTISKFQYQRFEMEKRIKVNINQDYQTYNGLTKYNYLKITQLNENNSVSIYYYFIRSAKQISESTIEFIIRMDVLNTFHYYTISPSTSQNNYSLSDKSLITREHKNRFQPKTGVGLKDLTELEKTYAESSFDGGYDGEEPSPIFFIGYAGDIANYVRKNGFFGMFLTYQLGVGPQIYGIDLYFNNQFEMSCAQIIFGDSQIELDDENGDDIEFISWDSLINSNVLIGLKFRGLVDTDTTNWNALSMDLDGHQYWNYFYPDGLSNPIMVNKKIVASITELYRVIDKYYEGIEAITFKESEKTLYDLDGDNNWYVVYSSSNSVTANPDDTASKYINPVEVGFYSDAGYQLVSQVAITRRYYATEVPQYANTEEFLIITKEMLGANGYIEVAGTQYKASDLGNDWQESYCIEKVRNNDMVFRRFGRIARAEGQFFTRQWIEVIAENFAYVDFYDVNYIDLYCGWNLSTSESVKSASIPINSGSSTTTFTSPAFNELDLTDPKLIKIINFPYAPIETIVGAREFSYLPENMVQGNNCLALNKPQKSQFLRTLDFEDSNPFTNLKVQGSFTLSKRTTRNIKYESKLFHSDYFIPKFVYDSFAFQFRLEDMDINHYIDNQSSHFYVDYACSNNIQSKFLFKFNQYVCTREVQDYNDVLIIDRNNEKALYTNAYINYIKAGGFRFDSKNADSQKLANGLTIAFSTLGAIASFVSTPVTGVKGIAGGIGLAISTASKTISSIMSAQQNDRAIAQKMLQLNNQSTNVSTSEDIDLLKIYSNNKAKICYYKISSYLENALWDLFHYFGYKCNDYKIPIINSRCNFNFVQGEVILCDYTFNEEIANEITNKWKEGITFMHWDSGTSSYDLYQEYENFENNLLN